MGEARKYYTVTEEILTDIGGAVAHPTRKACAAAVIPNPWAGRGYVPDLSADAAAVAPRLAYRLTEQLAGALGGTEYIAAFGKAGVVGQGGEIEHAAALIHTPYFGNVFRELTQASSVIVFADAAGPAGTPVTVPMWHTTAAGTRSHYQTMSVRIPEAPRDDEIVVFAAASNGARPNARIGDRTTDPAVRLTDLELTP